ncbi:MAG: alpha/beta fold hydrolase, partial [Planctomycetota bacterium]
RGPIVLVGSSLGGWIATLLANEDPAVAGLLLLAPAFDCIAELERRCAAASHTDNGTPAGRVLPLPDGGVCTVSERWLAEARRQPACPEPRCPTVVIYGRRDTVVPERSVRRFVEGRPQVRLVLVDDDHRLLDSLEVIDVELDALLVQIAAGAAQRDGGQAFDVR